MVGGATRSKIADEVKFLRRRRGKDIFLDLNGRKLCLVHHAIRHWPALQDIARSIHHIAFAIAVEIAGTGIKVARVEVFCAILIRANRQRSGEEALARNGHGERVFHLLNRALHLVGKIWSCQHGAGAMHFGIAFRNIGYEIRIGPLEAGCLRVGDIVRNVPKRARLRTHAAQGSVHRAIKRHG